MKSQQTIEVATSIKRIGSLPACLALKSLDIGEATLSTGEIVTITWGRNMTAEQVDNNPTVFRAVRTDAGLHELIIPCDHAAKLRSIIFQ